MGELIDRMELANGNFRWVRIEDEENFWDYFVMWNDSIKLIIDSLQGLTITFSRPFSFEWISHEFLMEKEIIRSPMNLQIFLWNK